MDRTRDAVVPDLPDEGRWAYRFSVTTLVLAFVLIFAGALVTSTNSGMAFRTWPDADDRYLWPDNPSLSGILEHSHRLLGAALGLFAILLVVVAYVRDRRPMIRRLSVAFLILVVVQGLLGGARVLLDAEFPVLFPIVHGGLAQLTFAFAGILVFASSLMWIPRAIESPEEVRVARRLAVIAWVAVFVQMLLGVLLRHTDDGVAKWSHLMFSLFAALSVLVASAYSLGKFKSVPGFTRMNRTLLAILVAQVALGFVTLVVRRPKHLADTSLMGKATLVSLHVVLGAGLLLMTSILVARSYRNLVPRGDARAPRISPGATPRVERREVS